MGNYGALFSTQGNDALLQPDNRRPYSTKFSTLKIYKKGYIAVTTNGSGVGTGKVLHGLGYAPTFYVWRKSTASYSFLDGSTYPAAFHPCPGTSSPWIPYHNTSDAYSDASYLNFNIQGANSTTYYFVYFIFIDQAEFNIKNGLDVDGNYGAKFSKSGNDADTAKEQQIQLSADYKTLKYHKDLITDYPAITLPSLAGSYFDQTPEEGTYVDFFHSLGYPPFFLAFAQGSGSEERVNIPDIYIGDLLGTSDYALTGWCDKSRIRITWWRKAYYNRSSPSLSTSFSTGSFSIKLYIFSEDLNIIT